MDYQTRDELGDDLYNRIDDLEKHNKGLVIELMQMSAEKVQAEEGALRLEVQVEDLTDLQWLKEGDERTKLLRETRKEARRLSMLIKIHKLHTHHNLCFMNDLVLWRGALRDNSIEYPHDTIPPEEEFDQGCEAWCKPYYRSRSKCQGQLPIGKPPALPGYEESK